ncbi:Uncharacterized protein TCAP_02949 [Tolypocladium capitatum]|uniref:Uncharacterized protein n=1 Tax=Tolypocladium capitatum TaxID=45235 RepID=A0A2K3QHX1_9HYPO|nr:Uncharacterized protein TCAP_02949 [Tolypocladium capitatum]
MNWLSHHARAVFVCFETDPASCWLLVSAFKPDSARRGWLRSWHSTGSSINDHDTAGPEGLLSRSLWRKERGQFSQCLDGPWVPVVHGEQLGPLAAAGQHQAGCSAQPNMMTNREAQGGVYRSMPSRRGVSAPTRQFEKPEDAKPGDAKPGDAKPEDAFTRSTLCNDGVDR